MDFTKEELQKIRENLPPGGIGVLTERFGFKNPGSIRNILSGRANNPEVIAAAVQLAKDYKDQQVQNTTGIKAAIAAL